MKEMFHKRLKWLLAAVVLLVPSASCQENVIIRGLEDSVYNVGDIGHLQVLLNQTVDDPGVWYKDGKDVRGVTGKLLILDAPTARQLVIYNVQYGDSGNYTLTINGVNTSATVTIGTIDILIGLRDVKVEVGKQMSFQTTLSASNITEGYWTKNGVPLTNSVKYEITVSNQVQRLTITSLTTGDIGTYTYSVRGKNTSANLDVEANPVLRILQRLQSMTVAPGQPLELRVTLSQPNVSLGTWYRNGVPVSESENRQISVNENVHQLLITNVQAARDSGIYVYIVRQLVTVANIAVQEINILTNLEDFTATLGSTVSFTCRLSESGVDVGVWRKDGKTLSSDGRITITTLGQDQVLTIRTVQSTDAGLYRYTIGSKETSALLNIANDAIAFTACLVIDGSESVQEANFLIMKNLMKSYISRTSTANNQSRAGVVVFSDSVTSIPISANLSALTRQIDALAYPGQGTSTHLGIDQARQMLLQDSTLNPKIMIVVTDGASDNEVETRTAAQRAKDAGITIFAVGITEFVSSSASLLAKLEEEISTIINSNSNKISLPTFSNLTGITSETLYGIFQNFVAGISITQEMVSQTALTGSLVSLTVRVNRLDVTLGVWSKNGLPLVLGQKYKKSVSSYLQKLDIISADLDSAGLYTFTVGKQSSSASVTLFDAVNNVTTYTGGQAVFRTHVAPAGVSSGQWSRSGAALANSSKYTMTNNELVDKQSRQLAINTVQVSDQGFYSFTLNGVATRGNLIVTALRITSFLQPLTVTEGSATNLETTLSLPDIDTGVWRKDGVEIVGSQNIQISTEGRTQRLLITETGLDAAGEYSYSINGLLTRAQVTVVPTRVDGNVTQWTQWNYSPCSATCGPGQRNGTRSRTCTNPAPAFGGRNCTQPLLSEETVICTDRNCPVNGGFTTWTNWAGSGCNPTCGSGGVQVVTRNRTCTNPSPMFGGSECVGAPFQSIIRTCAIPVCPVNGGFTIWTNWAGSGCNPTCGPGGVQLFTRTRTCTNPRPTSGGSDCVGPQFQSTITACVVPACPVDGNVTQWTQWNYSSCSATCGPGQRNGTRSRTCTNPAPAFGGRNCTQPLLSEETVNCTDRNCPVNGGFTTWTNWAGSGCNPTCGSGGVQVVTRNRTCTNPSPMFGGSECVGAPFQSIIRTCAIPVCPVDGNVTQWTQWNYSPCSATCGPGERSGTRSRTCTNPAPAFGGSDCTQPLFSEETVNCTDRNCSIDGGVTAWTEWSGPSCNCSDASTRTLNRYRTCTNPPPQFGGQICRETLIETVTRTCDVSNCPVDGGVSEWSDWVDGECSQTCGATAFKPRTRTRTCTNPPPSNGGLECRVTLTARTNVSCNSAPCPIDGNVTQWAQWNYSPCSATCGPGQRSGTRSRTCTNPTPAFGGSGCTQPLVSVEIVNCTDRNCPIDGGVTAWTEWSGPSCNCSDASTRTLNRYRTCTNPPPQFGGQICRETLIETVTRTCVVSNCPVDGGVSEWSDWVDGECSQTCGVTAFKPRTRTRTCTNPPPSNGGLDCRVTLTARTNVSCNSAPCPIDGNVTQWAQWNYSPCSATCGPGQRSGTRSRTCTNPTPAFGGSGCTQPLVSVETVNCTDRNCPIDGGVTAWTEWSGPSCNCSDASTRTLNRYRTCTNPPPQFGGQICRETLIETVTRTCDVSNCPVDGGVSEWSDWVDGECSQTCGVTAFKPRTRTRTCTNPPPSNGGLDCRVTLTARTNVSCNSAPCPIDGNVTQWAQWNYSPCSATCGPGQRSWTRSRTCTNPTPAFGGSGCTQPLVSVEIVNCTDRNCPIDGGVTAWTEWSGPSCNCSDASTRTLNRYRTCTNPPPQFGGQICRETLIETVTRTCDVSNCPVDGGVSEWSDWVDGECSQTCGVTAFKPRTRTRTCTNPPPSNGGLDCQVTLTARTNVSCNSAPCPIDGNVTQWAQWNYSPCSATCGPGQRSGTRSRTCTNPTPAFGGSGCTQPLVSVEIVNCTDRNCPIDGGVTAWTEWSGPSCNCSDASTRTLNRYRTCTNPPPQFGGQICRETLIETVTRTCDVSNCPVDGGVSEWSDWVDGECSQTCGVTAFKPRTRTRTCTNPPPSNGGLDCQVTLTARTNVSCNSAPCPIDGNVTQWAQWNYSPCSATCGPGQRSGTRSRTCTNPTPAFGGSGCTQPLVSVETVNCTDRNCPIDGGVTAWTEWSGPSCNCSDASTRTLNRYRTCTNPPPQFGGQNCRETLIETVTRTCDVSNCPVDGGVSEWSDWVDGECSQTCGVTAFKPRTRTRTCTNPPPSNGGLDCRVTLTARTNVSCNSAPCPIGTYILLLTNDSSTYVAANITLRVILSANASQGFWFKDNIPVVNNDRTRYSVSGLNHELTITNVTESDAGSYGYFINGNFIQGNLTVDSQVDGNFTEWGEWSNTPCGVTCGQTATKAVARNRTCINPESGGANCVGPTIQTKSVSCGLDPCPIDGGISDWGMWTTTSPCTATCGERETTVVTRTRSCSRPQPRFGGRDCTETRFEAMTRSCNLPRCPNDQDIHMLINNIATYVGANITLRVVLSANASQGFWFKDNIPVVDNDRTRYSMSGLNHELTITNVTESDAGSYGYFINRDFIQGNLTVDSQVDGNFTEWGEWSNTPCGVTCGQTATKAVARNRTCINPESGGANCVGPTIQTKSVSCGLDPCPIDGGISDWGMWTTTSPCTATCGERETSVVTRTRNCSRPQPRFDGRDCTETRFEAMTRSCNLPRCPNDPDIQMLINNIATYVGANITLRVVLSANASQGFWFKDNIPVVDNDRTRYSMSGLNHELTITNVTESDAGSYGYFINRDFIQGNLTVESQVDGNFTEWGEWSNTPCGVTCGQTATKAVARNRTCINPESGGANCVGPTIQTKSVSCGLDPCPIDGGISDWGMWTTTSPCTATCGERETSVVTRTRNCSRPQPRFDGRDCTETRFEAMTRSCNLPRCPIDGGISDWGMWTTTSPCTATCGERETSVVTRTRSCSRPQPRFGGRDCTETRFEAMTRSCNLPICPNDPDIQMLINNIATYVGANITLRVVLSANASQGFWFKDNIPVVDNDRTRYSMSGLNHELTITNVTESDAGSYGYFINRDFIQGNLTVESQVDGNFTEWGEWSNTPCGVTCGQTATKTVTRQRTCINPPSGGANCVGPSRQTTSVNCGLDPCPTVTGVCDNVVMRYGIGYRYHPTDCDKYIQCYFNPNGSVIGIHRSCSFGYSWDQATLRCVETLKVSCPMAAQQCGAIYKMEGNCRSYRKYEKGRLEARCCSEGFSFSPTVGCRPNFYCDDVCPSPYFSRDVCDKHPDWTSPQFYNISVGDFGWSRTSCPPKSAFDILDCGCSIRNTETCEARYAWAFGAATTPSWLTIRNVTTRNDVGIFNINSSVFLDIKMTTSNQPLAVKLRYRENAGVNDSRVLVNCTDKLVITSNNDGIQFAITNRYDIVSRIFISTNGTYRTDWKTVTALYKDRYLIGVVETGTVKYISQVYAKDVNILTNGVQLGSDASSDQKTAFLGDIDKMSVFDCDPGITF
ncbi:uncharacterized protein LOC124112132 [Haliotis rufescens]|uniref:uncharacterized protein LOC124112132 n=1 Tax=Haliotis rufescens TaxID=6454 RepID=UPI00201EC17D|nr:uncharacterized protein LOC124112132 [Haliotis rufescens]